MSTSQGDAVRRGRTPSATRYHASRSKFINELFYQFRTGQRLVPGRPPLLLGLLGIGLVGLAGEQLVGSSSPSRVVVLKALVPGVVAGSILVAGWWTTTVDRGAEKHAAAVIVSLLFMGTATATVGVIVLLQLDAIGRTFDWSFAVATTLAVGAFVGTPTGIALDEVIARQAALDAENRRTKYLNQRLQVTDRVLRHNVRNELTVALGNLEIATSDASSPAVVPRLLQTRDALERLHTHTEKIVKLGTTGWKEESRTTIDLVEYLAGFLEQADPSEYGTITTEFPSRALVSGHPLLGTAVVEVVENAVEHSDDDVEIDVRIANTDEAVEFVVADTGPGIPEMEIDTLDSGMEIPLHHGQGVGLWLVKWVTEASGGTATFEDNDPTGTVVRLELPRPP